MPRPDGGLAVSVGWLSCTWVGHFPNPQAFMTWAAPFLGGFVAVQRRFRGYELVLAGEHGVLAGYKWRDAGPDDAPILELHLDCPAAVLEGMALDALGLFLLQVAQHALNITRIDATLDDWDKRQTPMDLEILSSGADNPNELNKRFLVTRAKQTDFRRSKGHRGGDTWYLGGSKSDGRLRVYDKSKESGGEIDAIRWELQLRGEMAKAALIRLVLHNPAKEMQDMGRWCASELLRFVDFKDREADKNITRCPRLSWFSDLVGDAPKALPVVVPPRLTVERMHQYAHKALPSFLATLADSAPVVSGISPEAYILGLLDRGRRDRSGRHELALRSAGVA
jgi:DNA relaxase NicK